MSTERRRNTIFAAAAVGSIAVADAVAFMAFGLDVTAMLLVIGMAPAITLFALGYTFLSPWWRSMQGWALWQSSTGLALLVDISLLYKWLGDSYWLRPVVLLAVYSWIFLGAYLKLIAFAREKWRVLRHRGPDRFSTTD